MMRWIAILGLLATTGCTSQLGVLVEETNFVHLDDFADSTDFVEETVLEQPNVYVEEVVIAESGVEVIEEVPTTLDSLVGVPVTVEALLGKVNGRPIFANAVLEPVEDKFLAALHRDKLTQTQFVDYILVELYDEVLELVKRDLLLSEANAGISPELAHGLFAVIGQMRKDFASTQGGSSAQMRQLTKEQDDVSVDSLLESNKDKILIDKLYREKIWPNVNVTWRDIQRVFEKIYIEESNSTIEVEDSRIQEILAGMQKLPLEAIPSARGSILLGMIRLSNDDPRIETVTKMFEGGRPFLEVAASVDARNGGVWEKFDLKEGGIASIGINQTYRDGLLNSKEENRLFTHTTEKSQYWIVILEFEEPISLYNREIQIAVRNQLRSSQFYSEENRFLQSIWNENGMLEIEEMAARVAKIALQRYFQ